MYQFYKFKKMVGYNVICCCLQMTIVKQNYNRLGFFTAYAKFIFFFIKCCAKQSFIFIFLTLRSTLLCPCLIYNDLGIYELKIVEICHVFFIQSLIFILNKFRIFQKKRESLEAPTPDSTTVESKSYICGEEVLVHLNDERFYLGFIAKVSNF